MSCLYFSLLLLLACQSDMKKVEIEVGVLELRRSFSFFLGGGVDHMVFNGKGGGQSSSKEYKRGIIENEGGE